MTESTFLHSGVEYCLIPGYFPLAISRQGSCINTQTKLIKRWNRVGNVFQLTHTSKTEGVFCLTLCRALALCFLPIPIQYSKLPINQLRAHYTRKPEDLQQAVDMAWIRWGLKNKTTAVIKNTKTQEVKVYPDFAQASLSLSGCSNLIYNLQTCYGNRFVYEHYEVNIYTR